MDTASKFKSLGSQYLPEILQMIDETVRASNPQASTLGEMSAYHMSSGGKRLRAMLPLMVADSLGYDPSRLIPFGAACEMLHNATLVHDDLQDGDRTRRGQETVWCRYGAPQAINLGDAMFYYALLLLENLNVTLRCRQGVSKRLLLGTLQVLDGQEREFALTEMSQPTLADYFRMVEGKTSGLFAIPMAGAATVCGASPRIVSALEEAATEMGVLFQIQDDLLDLFGDKGREEKGSDIAEGKRSALVVYALEHSDEESREWLRAVLDKPRERTSSEEIAKAITLLRDGGALEYTLGEIARRRRAALAAVAKSRIPALEALVLGMCDLFLAPIQGLFEGEHDPEKKERAFCVEMLPKVSRTFALSIEMLPLELRSAVRVAYLLCRTVDAVEDDAVVDLAGKRELFALFDSLVGDDTLSVDPFKACARELNLGGDSPDGELVANSDLVFSTFRRLALAQRDAIRPHLLCMSGGMKEYMERGQREKKLRLSDVDDLERYCYFVAGTVGELLTSLFEQTMPDLAPELRAEIHQHSVSFGLGLQMVNIVKDVATDYQRGDCFLPESLADEYGISLDDILDPQKRMAALSVVQAVCKRARVHLKRAETYTALWPVPAGQAIRLFCTVPLALALATLKEVEEGSDTLNPGRTPKVSREVVARVLGDAQRAIAGNGSLSEMLTDYAPRENLA